MFEMENKDKKYIGSDTNEITYARILGAMEKPTSLVGISEKSGSNIKTVKGVVYRSVDAGIAKVEKGKTDGRGRPPKTYSLTDMGKLLRQAF